LGTFNGTVDYTQDEQSDEGDDVVGIDDGFEAW
jgi:hypothetical protein